MVNISLEIIIYPCVLWSAPLINATDWESRPVNVMVGTVVLVSVDRSLGGAIS